MIQDIFPHSFNNAYRNVRPAEDDRAVIFVGSRVLMKKNGNEADFPMCEDVHIEGVSYRYLFSIDRTGFFLAVLPDEGPWSGLTDHEERAKVITSFMDCKDSMVLLTVRDLYRTEPAYIKFAASTALQLKNWYMNTRFCGRCGRTMTHDDKERMMKCECGNTVYPKISPAIIAAVMNGDKLLLTKYADREYKRFALIAGFAEVGESIEDTVRREVMEEVGVNVTNIRFYKSQPWSFSDTLLIGFFCDLDGSDEIHLDKEELSTGVWMDRKDIDIEYDGISLTNEMIIEFKEGRAGAGLF